MKKGLSIVFPPGALVTLRTDIEKHLRIVTRVIIDEDGAEYGLRCSDRDMTWHKPSEMLNYVEEKSLTPGFRIPATKRKAKR